MSIASDCFCSTVLFIIPSAVLVSASNVVSGCLGPMFSAAVLSGTALPTMGKLVH